MQETCKAINDKPHMEYIREKLAALPVDELIDTAVKLSLENKDLQENCEGLKYELRRSKADADAREAFLKGQTEGLKYSIRCNGVSGGEIK